MFIYKSSFAINIEHVCLIRKAISKEGKPGIEFSKELYGGSNRDAMLIFDTQEQVDRVFKFICDCYAIGMFVCDLDNIPDSPIKKEEVTNGS